MLEQWSLYCIFGVSIFGIVTVKDLQLLINGPAPSELAVETLFTSLLDFLAAERMFIRQAPFTRTQYNGDFACCKFSQVENLNKLMRENNECNIFQQQATFLISLNNYDKRALTVTDLGPLTHSLLNLAYLSASSPQKISSLLIGDGGLALLIKKLSRLKYPAQKLPYSAILSILANLIIRGNSVFRFMCFSLNIIKPLSQLLKESLPVDVKDAHVESTFQRIGESRGIVPIRGPLEEREPLEIPDTSVTEMIGNFDDVVLVIKIIAYLSKYQGMIYN